MPAIHGNEHLILQMETIRSIVVSSRLQQVFSYVQHRKHSFLSKYKFLDRTVNIAFVFCRNFPFSPLGKQTTIPLQSPNFKSSTPI